jgi:Mn2+/Fe2+ NRAMP family transporter
LPFLGPQLARICSFGRPHKRSRTWKRRPKRDPLKYAPRQAEGALGRIRLDTYIGMAFSNLVAIAINVTTAATLHVAGTTNIQTSSEAAEATYSQVGAQFGFSISWTMLFSYPLMAAIQEISGRIGRTTASKESCQREFGAQGQRAVDNCVRGSELAPTSR